MTTFKPLNEMHPYKIRTPFSLIACMVMLAACAGYGEGFEYQSKTSLDATSASGVTGAAILGSNRGNTTYRIRIALYGLGKDKAYQVRFFDAPGCSAQDLMHADRMDGLRTDGSKGKKAWGFDTEPLSLTGNVFGIAKKDFEMAVPSGRSLFRLTSDMLPTIVVYAPVDSRNRSEPKLEQVACGRITSTPLWQAPHT